MKQWCRPKESDPYAVICKVCNKAFNVDAQGFPSLTSHSKSEKHRQAAKAAYGDQQVKFVLTSSSSSVSNGPTSTNTAASHKSTIDMVMLTELQKWKFCSCRKYARLGMLITRSVV